jgi:hypothetical protein
MIIPARNALQLNTSGPDRPVPAPKIAVERTLSLQGSHRGSGRQTCASYTPGLVNVCLRAVSRRCDFDMQPDCPPMSQVHVRTRRLGAANEETPMVRVGRRYERGTWWMVRTEGLGQREDGAKRRLSASFRSVRVGRVYGRGSTSGGFVRQNRSPSDPASVQGRASRAPR